MSDKKKQQLGMNPSTASSRLVKDILWNYVVNNGDNQCYQCGLPMTRETFSIEHKEPWMDSDDPVGLYFDIENISYSHLSCNYGARRRTPAVCGTTSRYQNYGCRCEECCAAKSSEAARHYTKEKKRRKILEKRKLNFKCPLDGN